MHRAKLPILGKTALITRADRRPVVRKSQSGGFQPELRDNKRVMNYLNRRSALIAMAGATAVRPASAVEEWKSLFDGRTLKGWRANLPASWRVDGGTIVADGQGFLLGSSGDGDGRNGLF